MSAAARIATADAPSAENTATIARIGRNFSFRMASQILSAVINVAAMVLLARHLTAAQYGDYAYYYALVPLLASLADFGVGVIVTREIARRPDEGPRIYGDALAIKWGLSALILILGVPGILLAADHGVAMLLILIVATSLLDFGQDPAIWIMRAHERLDMEAWLLLVSQVLRLAVLAVAIWMHASLAWLLGAATIAFGLRLVVGMALADRHFYRPTFDLDPARIRNLLKEGLPFCLAMFGVVFYARVGVLMLKAFASAEDVAYFNIGYMLSQPLGFISSALSIAAFPALSRRAQLGREAMETPLLHTTKYQLLVALPLTAALLTLAPQLVPFLFPKGGYGDAVVAFQVTSLALLFVFMNLMARYVLTAVDRQSDYLRAIVVGMVVNIVLCALLIPRFRFLGAGAAWVIAEISIFAVCQWSLSSYVRFAAVLRELWRPLLAALAMGAALWLMRGLPLAVLVAAGCLIYAAALLAVRAFSPEEIRMARGLYVSLKLPGFRHLSRVEHHP